MAGILDGAFVGCIDNAVGLSDGDVVGTFDGFNVGDIDGSCDVIVGVIYVILKVKMKICMDYR